MTNMNFIALSLALCTGLFTLSSCTTANSGSSSATTSAESSGSSLRITQQALRNKTAYTPYPFDHCAVIQRPFSEKPVRHQRIYKGQEVLFCCTPCVKSFDANPGPYMPRIYAASGGGAN